MADFMGDNVRLCEIARSAEPCFELLEERQVQIDLLIVRAIKRPHGRLANPARRLRCLREEHERGLGVVGAAFTEDVRPDLFRVFQHNRYELSLGVVRRHTGSPDDLVRGLRGDDVDRILTRQC